MTRVWQAGEEGGEDVAGCGGIITQAPTDIMHKCACTNARNDTRAHTVLLVHVRVADGGALEG